MREASGRTTPAAQPNPSRGTSALPDAPPGYKITGELGRGGMGVVFRAVDTRLGREVALKMVLGGGFADTRGRGELRLEAEAQARLNHPGVVGVYEIGEHQGLPFLALEFCPGGTLSSKLGGRPMPARPAAKLLERVADAVAAAHAAGLVHRDLKPGNILFAADGTPKVADFGLAKVVDSRGATKTGEAKGTLAYMAPEQAEGARDVTPAADVYALGAVLYEMLTGRPPLVGENEVHTLYLLMSQEPVSVRSLAPRVPLDLDTVCHKCLSKDPRRRYRDAGELAADLKRFVAGEPVRARPVGRWEKVVRWCRRRPAVAGLSALVGLSVLAGVVLTAVFAEQMRRAADRLAVERDNVVAEQQNTLRERDAAEAARRQAVEAAAETERARGRTAEALEQADRERRFAQATVAELMIARGILLAEQGDPAVGTAWLVRALRSPAAEGGTEPGRRLRESLLRLLGFWAPHVGPAPRTVLEHPEGGIQRGLLFSRDGRRLATEGGTHWMLWDAETGRHLATTEIGEAPVAFSSDGRRLLTVDDKRFALRDAATGQPIPGPVTERAATAGMFSPDGTRVLTLHADAPARLWNAADGSAIGPAPGPAGGLTRSAAYSPDGSRLALAGADQVVRIFAHPDGRPLGQTPAHDGPVSLRFSADGRRLLTTATVRGNGPEGRDVLRVWNSADAQPAGPPLMVAGGVGRAAISDDGRLAAAVVYRGTLRTGATTDVRVWEAASGRVIAGPLPTRGLADDLRFSADGLRVTMVGYGHAAAWECVGGRPLGDPAAFRGMARVFPSPDGLRLAAASEGALTLFDAATLLRTGPAPAMTGGVSGAAFGGTTLAVADELTVRLWDLPLPAPAPVTADPTPVFHVAALSDGGFLGVGFQGAARIVDAAGKPSRHWAAGAGPIGAAVSADGRRLLVLDAGTKPHTVWDVATGKPVGNLPAPRLPAFQAALSADGSRVALFEPASLEIRSVDTGKLRFRPLTFGEGVVHGAAFSPDGRLLAVASKTARFRDTSDGRPVGAEMAHARPVSALAFAPDGCLLATASEDRTVRLWRVPDGLPVGEPLRHEGGVTALTFSPDGRLLATISGRTVRFWDVVGGRPLGPPIAGGAMIDRGLAFSADGRRLAIASADGLQILAVPAPMADEPERIRLWMEVHTGRTFGDSGEIVEMPPDRWLRAYREWNTPRP